MGVSAPKRREQVAELASKGIGAIEMAEKFGVTRQRVYQIAKRHGIKLPRERSGEQRRDALRVARRLRLTSECAGMTAKEASSHLGLSVVCVRNDAKAVGFKLATPPLPRRKDRTVRIIEAAPNLALKGLSKTDAAHEIGVSPAVFSIVVWKYCPDIKWHDGRVDGERTRQFAAKADVRRRRLLAECKGMSKKEAAAHLGIGLNTVSNDAKAMGFEFAK